MLSDKLDCQLHISVRSGATQKSIFAPDLRNVLDDRLLKTDKLVETHLVGCAKRCRSHCSGDVKVAQLGLGIVIGTQKDRERGDYQEE